MLGLLRYHKSQFVFELIKAINNMNIVNTKHNDIFEKVQVRMPKSGVSKWVTYFFLIFYSNLSQINTFVQFIITNCFKAKTNRFDVG